MVNTSIKLLIMVTGEHIISCVNKHNETYKLTYPMKISYSNSDNIKISKWIALSTSTQFDVVSHNVIAVCEPQEVILKEYEKSLEKIREKERKKIIECVQNDFISKSIESEPPSKTDIAKVLSYLMNNGKRMVDVEEIEYYKSLFDEEKS